MNTNNLVKEHSIKKLINQADIGRELKRNLNNFDFNVEIEKIDNAFIEWRYVYEYNEKTINNGFLIELCDTLEKINRDKILENYNLNMLESFL